MTTHAVRQLLDEIDEKQQRLDEGADAWSNGDDECAMASCDPSDQYVLEEEIISLWKQVYSMAKEKL